MLKPLIVTAAIGALVRLIAPVVVVPVRLFTFNSRASAAEIPVNAVATRLSAVTFKVAPLFISDRPRGCSQGDVAICRTRIHRAYQNRRTLDRDVVGVRIRR